MKALSHIRNELSLMFNGDTTLAQVIRNEDRAVVARLPGILAECLRFDYDLAILKGEDDESATYRAITGLFHYDYLVEKQV